MSGLRFGALTESVASWSHINRIQAESPDGIIVAISILCLCLKNDFCNQGKTISKYIYSGFLDLAVIRCDNRFLGF